MSDSLDPQLLGHLLGALDDDEQEEIESRLRSEEGLRRELVRWRWRIRPIEAMRPDYEPPPGLAARTCRYVAAHSSGNAAAPSRSFPGRMSPLPYPPSFTIGFGRMDAVAIAFIVAAAVLVVFPAIDSSRFSARLTSCQDGLRQFGSVLTGYGQQRGDSLPRLVDGGTLTPKGVEAVELIRQGHLADHRQTLCPDAWLAAQGALERASLQPIENTPPKPAMELASMQIADTPGMWRDGTIDGRRLSASPAARPLLADDPSADLPGGRLNSHGGLGRNLLFEDGHSSFTPATASPTVTAPIHFVSGHSR